MPGQRSNQALTVGTVIASVVAMLTIAALVATESSDGDSGTAFGLGFMVIFYFVSLPAHGLLTLGAISHSIRVGFRPIRWIFAYLLLAIVIHLTIADRIGAFDKLGQRLMDWQRGQEMPAQIALERAVNQPADIAAVRAAIAAGADPDALLPGVPLTPLFAAALRGDAALVSALLQGGADPNRHVSVDGGFSGVAISNPLPLDAAAFSEVGQRLATVNQLLDHGADAKNSHASLGACAQGDLSLYELLVAAGASDVPDNKGNQCLHVAAMRDQPELAARLIADGADPNAANMANQRPLDIAIIRNHFATALIIAQGGGFPDDAKRVAQVLDRESQDPAHSVLRQWLLENRR